MLTDVVIANKSYAKLTVSENGALDSIALQVIRRESPDFLLPIKAMEIDGEMELRYELLDGVRLSYMPKEMCKKDFIELLVNMLTPFKSCSDWFLDYHNFLLDENYILIGKNGRSVRYVYLPASSYANTDEAVKDFFTGIILKTDIKDDLGYMVNLLRIIKNPDSNLLTLLEYFQQESAPKAAQAVEKTAPKMAAAVKEIMEEKASFLQKTVESSLTGAARAGQIASEFGKHDEAGRLMDNLFGAEEEEPAAEKKKKKEKQQKSGGLLNLFKGKTKTKQQQPASNTGQAGHYPGAAGERQVAAPAPSQAAVPNCPQIPVGRQMESEDETMILNRDETVDNRFLRLRLENCTGCSCPDFIEIDLQRGYATVGRLNKNGEAQSDFNFDASVSFVSRRHFRVELSQDHWKIVDLESTNGTFVNGEALLPNMPYPLKANDVIMIACNKRSITYRVF